MISRIGSKSDAGCRVLGVRENKKSNTQNPKPRTSCSAGFTLVELLAAASVAAVGCVFVLGALSRCGTSLATAQKTVTADHLLASKMWDIDLAHRTAGGGEPGAWSGVFDPPHASFRWSQTTKNISADFGQATRAVSDALLEETVSVFWTQGQATRDVSATRYVKRKKE